MTIRAMIQKDEICDIIDEMIYFVKRHFGWEDFEIEAIGVGSASFWVGCIVRETENVCVHEDGLSYKVIPKERQDYSIIGYIRFDCEVGGLLSGIFDEHVIVFSGKFDLWVGFRRIKEVSKR